MVARDDPMDTYLVHHPSALLGRPVEAIVFDPANPTCCGAIFIVRRWNCC